MLSCSRQRPEEMTNKFGVPSKYRIADEELTRPLITNTILTLRAIIIFTSLFIPLFGQAQNKVVVFDTLTLPCLDPFRMDKNYVINDNASYQQLLIHSSKYKTACKAKLPKINFRSKTLIGCLTSAGGCQAPRYLAAIEEENGNYKVKISIKTTGSWQDVYFQMHWFLVNKLEESQKIDFEISYL